MTIYIGVDVQLTRPCTYCVMAASGEPKSESVLSDATPVSDLVTLVQRYAKLDDVIIGIDAPRQPLVKARDWYFKAGEWTRRQTQRGWGRHCEVAIFSLQLARPQWTPFGDPPEWMSLGFNMFEAIKRGDGAATALEVFPSASATQLQATEPALCGARAESRGTKRDVLDARLAALTVRYWHRDGGAAVGDGDGLGSIVLPRPVRPSTVLQWPTLSQ